MQATQTKVSEEKVTVKDHVSELVTAKALLGRTVSVTCLNRTEDSYEGILQSLETAGAVIRFESRNAMFTTFIPFASILEISLREVTG